LRRIRDDHSTVLIDSENMKSRIKTLEADLDRANAECAELSERKKELEQVRLELETATSQVNELQSELDQLKTECEGLRIESAKVGPLEQEVDALRLAHLQASTEASTFKEHYESERQKLIVAEASLQETSTKLQLATEQVSTLTGQVHQLHTDKADLETEFKIQDRKSQRMVKELKAELQKERSTTSLARSSSMDHLSSIPGSPAISPRHSPPPMSPVPLTPPPRSMQKLTRQGSEAINSLSLLSASVANMELSQATMEEILRRDLDAALTKVGDLGEEKWRLEEKARFLEENLGSLNEELVRKTGVIQYYVTKTKQNVPSEHLTPERDKSNRRQSGVLGSLMRSGHDNQELSAELLTKMQAVMEETLLKNVQLQKDMATLANETGLLQKSVSALKEENNHYKEQLVRITSATAHTNV